MAILSTVGALGSQAFNAGSIYGALHLIDQPFYESLGRVNKSLAIAAIEMNKHFDVVSAGAGRLANTLAAVGTIAAIGLGTAVYQYAQFEKQMRNVNSIAKLSETQLKMLSNEVKQLALTLGEFSPKELAEGLYQIASSGYTGAAGMKVLESSAKSAAAGLTTVNTAAMATVGVLQAYGKGADDANHVSNVLFETVNLGIVSFEQLAQNIGDVTSVAAAAKISLEEVGGAIATVTRAGYMPAEAVTRIRRFIEAFQEGHGKGFAGFLKANKMQSGEQMLNELGFVGTVKALEKYTDGSTDRLAKVLRESRARQGAIALMRQDVQELEKMTMSMMDAQDGVGAQQKALEEQFKSLSHEFKLMQQEAVVAATNLGEKLAPAARDLIKWIRGLTESFKGVNAEFLKTAVGATLVFAAISKLISLGAGALSGLSNFYTAGVARVHQTNMVAGGMAEDAGFFRQREIRNQLNKLTEAGISLQRQHLVEAVKLHNLRVTANVETGKTNMLTAAENKAKQEQLALLVEEQVTRVNLAKVKVQEAQATMLAAAETFDNAKGRRAQNKARPVLRKSREEFELAEKDLAQRQKGLVLLQQETVERGKLVATENAEILAERELLAQRAAQIDSTFALKQQTVEYWRAQLAQNEEYRKQLFLTDSVTKENLELNRVQRIRIEQNLAEATSQRDIALSTLNAGKAKAGLLTRTLSFLGLSPQLLAMVAVFAAIAGAVYLMGKNLNSATNEAQKFVEVTEKETEAAQRAATADQKHREKIEQLATHYDILKKQVKDSTEAKIRLASVSDRLKTLLGNSVGNLDTLYSKYGSLSKALAQFSGETERAIRLQLELARATAKQEWAKAQLEVAKNKAAARPTGRKVKDALGLNNNVRKYLIVDSEATIDMNKKPVNNMDWDAYYKGSNDRAVLERLAQANPGRFTIKDNPEWSRNKTQLDSYAGVDPLTRDMYKAQEGTVSVLEQLYKDANQELYAFNTQGIRPVKSSTLAPMPSGGTSSGGSSAGSNKEGKAEKGKTEQQLMLEQISGYKDRITNLFNQGKIDDGLSLWNELAYKLSDVPLKHFSSLARNSKNQQTRQANEKVVNAIRLFISERLKKKIELEQKYDKIIKEEEKKITASGYSLAETRAGYSNDNELLATIQESLLGERSKDLSAAQAETSRAQSEYTSIVNNKSKGFQAKSDAYSTLQQARVVQNQTEQALFEAKGKLVTTYSTIIKEQLSKIRDRYSSKQITGTEAFDLLAAIFTSSTLAKLMELSPAESERIYNELNSFNADISNTEETRVREEAENEFNTSIEDIEYKRSVELGEDFDGNNTRDINKKYNTQLIEKYSARSAELTARAQSATGDERIKLMSQATSATRKANDLRIQNAGIDRAQYKDTLKKEEDIQVEREKARLKNIDRKEQEIENWRTTEEESARNNYQSALRSNQVLHEYLLQQREILSKIAENKNQNIGSDEYKLTEEAYNKQKQKIIELEKSVNDSDKQLWEVTIGNFGDMLWNSARDKDAAKKYFMDIFQSNSKKMFGDIFKGMFSTGKYEASGNPVIDSLFQGTGAPLAGIRKSFDKVFARDEKGQFKNPKLANKIMGGMNIAGSLMEFGNLQGSSGEQMLSGAMSGAGLGMGITAAFGLSNPIGWALMGLGALGGGLFGKSNADRQKDEAANRLREQQLAELRKMNHALQPVSDYFRGMNLDLMPKGTFFGGKLNDISKAYSIATSRGAL